MGLTKQFAGGRAVVRDVDLQVPAGSVYGFLGPNGSGKTTTIRMLLGLVTPTSGHVELLGSPMPSAARTVLPRVGALVEGPGFHPYLTGRANLARLDAADRTSSRATSRARIADALDRVGLTAAADRRYRIYSLGMRQRLGIAAGLVRPRELLVLDEPTNGLDPQGTREMRSLIRRLGDDGVTVLVSSHLLGEVEQVCDHVGVMSAGSLVWQGELRDLGQRQRAEVRTSDPAGAATVLRSLGLIDVRSAHDSASGALGVRPPETVVAALVRAGIGVQAFTVGRPPLEDVFVELTGEGFDVSG